MKILVMSQADCKAARKHPAINGKKMIGAGQFSAVFEGSQPDTVYKLTVDPSGYWVFNDGVVGVQGRHFPESMHSFCDVGEVVIHANLTHGRPRRVPIFLYEQERLQPLPIKCDQRALAKQIIKKARGASGDISLFSSFADSRIRDVDDARVTLQELQGDDELPESIRKATADLARFCDFYDDFFLDMHFGNFMVRPATGELVFSDPIACSSIYHGHKNYR